MNALNLNYALNQLRGIKLDTLPVPAADRVQRALDWLESLQEALEREENEVLALELPEFPR